jgi:L-lysine exporter family protein LysE/ArgO
MTTAFLHGLILAFGLILPLGPQNAFILSQGARRTRWSQLLPVILTAASGDTFLILLAVLGVSVVVLTLPWLKTVLIVGGIGFLLYVGWLTWRSRLVETDDEQVRANATLRKQVLFTLAVSLLNPHAILDTIGVIGTSALAYTGQAKVAFTAACILNSWAWFFMLALAGRLLGAKAHIRNWLNRASAVVMWVSAAYLGYSLL